MKIFEYTAVRWVLIGTTLVLVSEVGYFGYVMLRAMYRRLRGIKKADDGAAPVSEVIWTNELTQMCTGHHKFDNVAEAGADAEGDDDAAVSTVAAEANRPAPSYISRLPVPSTSKTICHNRYCAANNVGRLIALIDQAKYTIDLAMYTFTSYELSQAFGRANKRGVDIRIISDNEMVYSSGSQMITLTKAGIPVRCPSTTMLMHHKFCILDGPLRAVSVLAKLGKTYDKKRTIGKVMSGSLNWTMQGFGGNWENILITSEKGIVQHFEEEYERMWIAFEHKLKSPTK